MQNKSNARLLELLENKMLKNLTKRGRYYDKRLRDKY